MTQDTLLTLAKYVEDVLTPSMLRLYGLPDTPEAREFLDRWVHALLEDDTP